MKKRLSKLMAFALATVVAVSLVPTKTAKADAYSDVGMMQLQSDPRMYILDSTPYGVFEGEKFAVGYESDIPRLVYNELESGIYITAAIPVSMATGNEDKAQMTIKEYLLNIASRLAMGKDAIIKEKGLDVSQVTCDLDMYNPGVTWTVEDLKEFKAQGWDLIFQSFYYEDNPNYEQPGFYGGNEPLSPDELIAEALRAEKKVEATGVANTVLNYGDNEKYADATFEVQPVTSGEIFTKAQAAVEKSVGKDKNFKVLEMNLTGSDNVAIHQLDGYVSVTLPVPEGLTVSDKKTITVYRVEDDGTMTKCETEVKDGKVTFKTNHFSTYVFVEEDVATVAATPAAAKSPKTGENAMPVAAGLLVLMALFAVASKKRFA